MRISIRLLSLMCALGMFAIVAAAQNDTATIRTLENGTTFVAVHLGKNVPLSAPRGALFLVPDDGPPELVTDQIRDINSTFDKFHFAFPPLPHPLAYKPENSYTVELIVTAGTADAPKVVKVNIDATTALTLSLTRSTIFCQAGIILTATTSLGSYDWNTLYTKLDELEPNPSSFVRLRIHIIGDDVSAWNDYPLQPITDGRGPQVLATKRLRMCLLTQTALPTEPFAAELLLNENRPVDFAKKVSKRKLAGTAVGPSPENADVKSPDDRLIEKNLDLGVAFTSSVANEEVPATGSTPATTTRQRTSRGIMDVRFAPWLDIRHPVIENNKWLNFFTPIYLNANVATGKIEEDTLSLNRVLIGFQGESRYRRAKNNQVVPNITHRFIYGGTHASDRDFKQLEFTGKIEYQPVFPKLNKPIGLNYTVNEREEEVPGNVGYTFLPKFGFELGRTYHRRNPAVAIKTSDTIRRFYFGLDLSLNVTRYLTFSVSDTVYLRGEAPGDRVKNYFKGGVEAPMGRVFKSAVHSLFFSFEKGDLAPFATPTVNSIKGGYRIQY